VIIHKSIPFFSMFANSFLLFLILKSHPREKLNRAFAILLFSMIGWSIGAFMIRMSETEKMALNAAKLASIAGMLVPVAYFHLICALLEPEQPSRIFFLGYGVYLIYVPFILFTPSLIGLTRNYWGYASRLAPPVFFFTIFSYALIFWGVMKLLRKRRRIQSLIICKRVKYLLVGTTIMLAGGIFDYLAAVGYPVYPVGIFTNLVFTIIVAYAILKYQLLSINILVRKSLLYFILTGLITTIFLVIIMTFEKFWSHFTQQWFIIPSLAVTILMAFAFQPLKNILQSKLDRLFFRPRYLYPQTVKKFSETLISILDLDRLLEILMQFVKETMLLDKIAILLRDDMFNNYTLRTSFNFDFLQEPVLEDRSPLVEWLTKEKKVLVREYLEANESPQSREVYRELETMGTGLAIPLSHREKLIGILFAGRKRQEELYTNEDLDLLTTLANQAAVALENAYLYRQMEKRVEEIFLLYTLSEISTRTLNFQETLEEVLKVLINYMHLQRVVIYLLDEEQREVINAVTWNLSGNSAEIPQQILLRQIDLLRQKSYELSSPFYPILKERNWNLVPLNYQDRLYGVLAYQKDYPHLSILREDARKFSVVKILIAEALSLAKSLSELARLKIFNENIIQSMHSGLITVDNEGRITSINKRAEEIFGCRREKLIGGKYSDVLIPRDKQQIEKICNSLGEKGVCWGEGNFIIGGRREIPLEYSISLLRNENGNTTGELVILQDITQKKKLQEQIKKVEKFSLMGELAAEVAHEIRNPLASIIGSLEILRKDFAGKDSESRMLISIINREAKRIENIVKSFLSFARPRPLKLEYRNLNSLVKEIIKGFCNRKDFNHGIEIFQQLSSEELWTFFDLEQMEEVLSNLLLNAVQAIDGKGKITVRTGQDSLLSPESESYIPAAVVEISDTGCGISSTQLPHIFEPFWSTKPQGTGLGLSIVKRIVESHRGTIEVKSGSKQGTTFTVRLPLISQLSDRDNYESKGSEESEREIAGH